MAKVNNLGEDNMKSLVLRLALPSMLAQFVNVLYGIIDRMYIGNLPQVGEVALAGVGVCGPLMTLISSFASLIGIGGSPLLAIRLGEKNQKGAEAILANCFVMLLGLSAALTAFFLALKGPLLMTFGASSVTFPYANSYMTIYTLGTVFAILSVGLNAFIICQGFSALGMLTVVIGAGMNIILDPILMFKLNMGVNGAAVATVLSQATSTLFVLWVLLGKRVPVRITFGGYSLKIMKRVVTFGFSPFIIIATDSILIIALNYVLQKYGGPSQGDMLITCSTVVQSYMQLITMPMGGITGGTQAILSYNYGAKKVDRIRQGEKYILAICVIFCAVMFAISQIAPQYFAGIFTQDPEYIKTSVWGIKVFTFCIIPLAFQYTFVDGLTALGIAKVAVSLSLFRKISFLALTLLLPAWFGATAAFFAEPAVDLIAGVTSTTVFCLLINKLLEQREQMPDDEALYS